MLGGWKKTKLWKFCNRKTCLWGGDIHVHSFERGDKPGLYLQIEETKSGNSLIYCVLVYSDYFPCLHLKWEDFSYFPKYKKRCAVSGNAPTHMLAELGKTLQQIWSFGICLIQRLRFILYNCKSLHKPTTFRALSPLAPPCSQWGKSITSTACVSPCLSFKYGCLSELPQKQWVEFNP